MIELSVVEPMYGREAAGHSATAAIHHPDDTIKATSAPVSCRIRLPSFGGPAIRYTRANAGRTKNAWSILVLNARPVSAADTSRGRVRPDSSAFQRAHAEARPRRVKNASGLLLRNIATAIGVS